MQGAGFPMLKRRTALHRSVLAGLLFLLGGWQFGAPKTVHAQIDSLRSQKGSASRPETATGTQQVRELFRQNCLKCHGVDGTGSQASGSQSKVPNFTDSSWQAGRTDAQLLASILDGKGRQMPSFRGKISEDQVRDLAAHVRSFAPTKDKPRPDKQETPASPSSFEEEFRRLQEEMDELKRQFREMSKGSADRERSKPSDSSPTSPHSEPPESSARPIPSKPSASAGGPADRELFRQHCEKCHAADGTGSQVRRLPELPNFTDTAWQARRGDAQLLASILDGKGKEMPPWRGKISEEQARGLVAYIRAFAPATEGPGPGPKEQKDATQTEPGEEAQPPMGFSEKLIRWLGKSHPAAVHFPIALLMAAAAAELLRLVTGKPASDAVSRYCVWFGTVTAVVASILGWFVGGFRLTDASWVLMTHRWLGTSTVACAGLVLLLTEVSRRPDRRRTRKWFRVTLLVVAALVLVTGYFGGAMVFGLNHYTWPP
jgi:mono/diheme cytochrome c family protein/uncharacterized membrane protein